MIVLGFSCFYHDSSAVIVSDGEILVAVQEERFSRVKHDKSFPESSIKFCLDYADLTLGDIDEVIFYEDPKLKLERITTNLFNYKCELDDFHYESLSNIIHTIKTLPLILRETFGSIGKKDLLKYVNHHISHASSSFLTSPFTDSAILTIDGVGEWSSTCLGYGKGNSVELLKHIVYPHSLGLLYSAFTSFCGFKVNSGEYKLMGLAPYGKPIYSKLIRDYLITLRDDGSFSLNLEYFSYYRDSKMTNSKFASLFGGPPREAETKITQREVDIAASIQVVTEEVVLSLANNAMSLTGSKNLCLSGGVALNCVSNGKLDKLLGANRLWIQPASGDAGTALGAALYIYYKKTNDDRSLKPFNSLLGPSYSNDSISQYLDSVNATYEVLHKEYKFKTIAKLLESGNIVGFFSGRMEFGPRALGARSILGSPLLPEMQKRMNLKIKFRESFRPFAPIVLDEHKKDYFCLESESPYMLLVSKIQESIKIKPTDTQDDDLLSRVNQVRSTIPAVTHVDYSARVQTVTERNYRDLHKLLEEFYQVTGCAVLVNTSFNVRGEPIVCTPEDSYKCFMRTNMDILVLEDCILYKKDNIHNKLQDNWEEIYELD